MTFIPNLIVSLTAGTGAGRAFYGYGRSPFCAGAKVVVRSPGAGTINGANHPGTLTTTKYAKFVSTNAVTYARATFTPLITAYDVTIAAALDQTKYLLLIVMVNGVMLERTGTDAAPGAGQWRSQDANTIGFGGTQPATGAVIEVISLAAADIININGGALTAGKPVQINMNDFVVAGTAAVVDVTAVANGV